MALQHSAGRIHTQQESNKAEKRMFPNGVHRDTRERIRRSLSQKRREGMQHEPAESFEITEKWFEPRRRDNVLVLETNPGEGYIHAATIEEVIGRLEEIPQEFRRKLEIVQLSTNTRKRLQKPLYGMQWGSAIYLYPIEDTLCETYIRPPKTQRVIDSEKYGGQWNYDGTEWTLMWESREKIRDYYLYNILTHEIGHICDDHNTTFTDRERFANAFAVEHGDSVYLSRKPKRPVQKRHDFA